MTDNSSKLWGRELFYILILGMSYSFALDMTAMIIFKIDGQLLLATFGILGGCIATAFGIGRKIT